MKSLMKKYDFDEFEAILGGLILTASFAIVVEFVVAVFR